MSNRHRGKTGFIGGVVGVLIGFVGPTGLSYADEAVTAGMQCVNRIGFRGRGPHSPTLIQLEGREAPRPFILTGSRGRTPGMYLFHRGQIYFYALPRPIPRGRLNYIIRIDGTDLAELSFSPVSTSDTDGNHIAPDGTPVLRYYEYNRRMVPAGSAGPTRAGAIVLSPGQAFGEALDSLGRGALSDYIATSVAGAAQSYHEALREAQVNPADLGQTVPGLSFNGEPVRVERRTPPDRAAYLADLETCRGLGVDRKIDVFRDLTQPPGTAAPAGADQQPAQSGRTSGGTR